MFEYIDVQTHQNENIEGTSLIMFILTALIKLPTTGDSSIIDHKTINVDEYEVDLDLVRIQNIRRASFAIILLRLMDEFIDFEVP